MLVGKEDSMMLKRTPDEVPGNGEREHGEVNRYHDMLV